MNSKRDIVRFIDEVEGIFIECWKVLLWFKDRNRLEDGPQRVLLFQGDLASILFDIEKKRRDVLHEKQSLIHRKGILHQDYFIARMKKLDEYQKALEQTAQIGYTIGDTFAWIFYRKSHKLLKAHYGKVSDPIQSSSGGIGEIQFIKQIKILEGYFVLYHGITTFLSIGDFSLVDLKQRKVVTTGEIKTSVMSNNSVKLSILIHGNKHLNIKLNPQAETKSIEDVFANYPEKFRQRNIRQYKKARSLLKENSVDEMMGNISTDSYYASLKELSSNTKCYTVNYSKAGDGMVLVGHRVRNGKLSSITLTRGHSTFHKDFDRSKHNIVDYLSPSKQKNHLLVGWLVYSPSGKVLRRKLSYGEKPVFWWNIPVDLAYSLIFQRFVVLSIYNLGYLADRLEDSGYEVEYNPTTNEYSVSMNCNNRQIRIESLVSLSEIIRESLLTEDAVISLLNRLRKQIETLDDEGEWRIAVERILH